MILDDTAMIALQRSLVENREAKRKIQNRLADLEAEAESLRSQMTAFNSIIEHTENALRRLLFNDEIKSSKHAEPAYVQKVETRSYKPAKIDLRSPDTEDTEIESCEIEAEVAEIKQRERRDGNVRFADFRIPQAATVILREADGPLHVSEIYRRMADGGFEFGGHHHLITLAVSLSRSKRFHKVAPGTFKLNPEESVEKVA